MINTRLIMLMFVAVFCANNNLYAMKTSDGTELKSGSDPKKTTKPGDLTDSDSDKQPVSNEFLRKNNSLHNITQKLQRPVAFNLLAGTTGVLLWNRLADCLLPNDAIKVAIGLVGVLGANSLMYGKDKRLTEWREKNNLNYIGTYILAAIVLGGFGYASLFALAPVRSLYALNEWGSKLPYVGSFIDTKFVFSGAAKVGIASLVGLGITKGFRV